MEEQVSADTPSTFLWATTTDELVPVQNSLLFYEALLTHEIPAELHLYAEGVHGLSLATPQTAVNGRCMQTECSSWISLAETWLKKLFC